MPISGYGVELALKKTDYIVIDDRRSSQSIEQKSLEQEEILDGKENMSDLTALSKSELASIGMKAASFIQKSNEPFDTLVKFTQDFPKFASSISSHNVSHTFTEEYKHNQAQMVRGGINFLWMNGAQLIERQIQPFTLVNMLRRERRLVDGIRGLGFDGNQAVRLLGHEAVSAANENSEPLRYDWTDRLEAGQVILWLNDLENDDRYSSYPKTLSSVRTLPIQAPTRTPPSTFPPCCVFFFSFLPLALAVCLRGVIAAPTYLPRPNPPNWPKHLQLDHSRRLV